MIIVEGPDGSGKSVLVEKLKRKLNIQEVIQWNNPPRNSDELALNLRESWLLTRQCVIQDRITWITEPIYDLAKKSTECKGLSWHQYIDANRAMKPVTLIYCRPPNEVIREHAITGNSPPDTDLYLEWIASNCDEIIALYDIFMNLIEPTLKYDWTKPRDEMALDILVNDIKRSPIYLRSIQNLSEYQQNHRGNSPSN